MFAGREIYFAVCVLLAVNCLKVSCRAQGQVDDEQNQVDRKPFVVVVLPDTQCYADTRLGFSLKHWKTADLQTMFFKQTAWIKDNKGSLNQFVGK